MKDVILFTNSTMLTPMNTETIHGKRGCVEILKQDYNVVGYGISGLTIFEARHHVPVILENYHYGTWIIVCLGVVEAYSHTAREFLHWYDNYIINGNPDHTFYKFIDSKLKEAKSNPHGFYRLLEPDEFRELFETFLWSFVSYPVICLGLSKPTKDSFKRKPHWVVQADEYRNVIESVGKKLLNIHYIDMWNDFGEYVVDSTHMTEEGHVILAERIRGVIG